MPRKGTIYLVPEKRLTEILAASKDLWANHSLHLTRPAYSLFESRSSLCGPGQVSLLFGGEGAAVVNINTAIDAYSYQGGNRPERLRAVCADSPRAADRLAAEIDGLQDDLYALVRESAGPEGLSRAEIEQLAQEYLAARRPDIDACGLTGLLRYVIWIAWHDGWLRRDNNA